jgi:hypothetical protein
MYRRPPRTTMTRLRRRLAFTTLGRGLDSG